MRAVGDLERLEQGLLSLAMALLDGEVAIAMATLEVHDDEALFGECFLTTRCLDEAFGAAADLERTVDSLIGEGAGPGC